MDIVSVSLTYVVMAKDECKTALRLETSMLFYMSWVKH